MEKLTIYRVAFGPGDHSAPILAKTPEEALRKAKKLFPHIAGERQLELDDLQRQRNDGTWCWV